MTLQQLHYAITIAEVGSLNKAAEILYIAQPSLTSSMKELQKEAFAYAYHCKREQPTVEEAQHAYESGAYPDEIGRDKA